MPSFKPTKPLNPETFSILLPGTSPETASLSEQLLIKNSEEFNIFNEYDSNIHNHLAHHLLSAYSLGASKEKIRSIYDFHAEKQRPLPPSVGTITRKNYKDHLGKTEAYTSFVEFFKSEVEHNGMYDTFRRFVWSGDFLTRTISGLYHPLMHTGFAIEFGVPGTMAEGLAMAACTQGYFAPLVPSFPELTDAPLPPVQQEADSSAFKGRGIFHHFSNTSLSQASSSHGTPRADTVYEHDPEIPEFLQSNQLLHLLKQIRQDEAFDIVKFEDPDRLQHFISDPKNLELVIPYAKQWKVEENEASIQEKVHEIYVLATLLAGATGIRDGYPLRLDFGLTHVLISVGFVHHYVPRITPSEAAALLRGYLALTMVYYVILGRPSFNYDGLFNYKSAHEETNNPWLNVFDRALSCEEVHVTKVVRACAVGQIIYGSNGNNTLNKIWLHMAQMACDKNGKWDLGGVGFEKSWENPQTTS